MAVRIVETLAPAQTESLGAELAAGLAGGDVVLVRGELGAGKTTFVRGAARALGVAVPVTSPSFSIGHRYRGEKVTVSHLDLYRLAGLAAEDPGLLDDYLGPDRIAFVDGSVSAPRRSVLYLCGGTISDSESNDMLRPSAVPIDVFAGTSIGAVSSRPSP